MHQIGRSRSQEAVSVTGWAAIDGQPHFLSTHYVLLFVFLYFVLLEHTAVLLFVFRTS